MTLEERRRTEIRFEGAFDVSAARRVARELEAARYAEVRVDLSGARELNGFAVALLAEAIAARRAPTVVTGLPERHREVLRRLGVEPGGGAIGEGT